MSSSPAHVRALYRSLLRWAAAHPDTGPALRAEAASRFRAGRGAKPDEAAALLGEAEARLFDATYHGIPHARLPHGSQHSVRALQEARGLGGGQPDAAAAAAGAAAGSADPGVRAALAAAAARLRARQKGRD